MALTNTPVGLLYSDAAALIRTIFQSVKYIHDCGIVHRGPFTHLASILPTT
jgi:serine/threonine protein kinase